jgi:hypothetical protein
MEPEYWPRKQFGCGNGEWDRKRKHEVDKEKPPNQQQDKGMALPPAGRLLFITYCIICS